MSIEEKNSLLQIPTDELKSMSTIELIEASINCMFARGIGRFSRIDEYYEEIYSKFNGFRELTCRNDVCKEIIEYYKSRNFHKEIQNDACSTIRDQIQRLEHLIVHPKILEKFTKEEENQLLSILKEKYAEKLELAEFNEHDRVSTVYALAKLLERKDQQTKQRIHDIKGIDMFLNSGIFLTRDVSDQILYLSK